MNENGAHSFNDKYIYVSIPRYKGNWRNCFQEIHDSLLYSTNINSLVYFVFVVCNWLNFLDILSLVTFWYFYSVIHFLIIISYQQYSFHAFHILQVAVLMKVHISIKLKPSLHISGEFAKIKAPERLYKLWIMKSINFEFFISLKKDGLVRGQGDKLSTLSCFFRASTSFTNSLCKNY